MSNVVRRRVQITGGSSFIVSLPKEWAKSVGLTPGSEVMIEILPDYTLRIIPPYVKSETDVKSKVIEVRPDNINAIIMDILSSYLAGYDVIKLKYKDLNINAIHRVVDFVRRKTVGLEVLEEKDNELILYSIMDTSSLTIREALGKMINITRMMLEDVERAFIKYNKEILQSVIERDDIVDKLFLLIIRELNQLLLGKLSPSQLGLVALPEALYVIISVKSIERIADHATLISKKMLEVNKLIISDQVVELFSKIKELYINATKGFKNLDKHYVDKALALSNELGKLEEQVRQEATNLMMFPEILTILESMRRIKAYSIDIIESSLNIIAVRELIDLKRENAT